MHREKRAGSPRSVVLRRRYPTDRADLWDAVTNPTRVARWYRSPETRPWEGALMSLGALVRGVDMQAMVALFVSGETWPGIAAAWDEVKGQGVAGKRGL